MHDADDILDQIIEREGRVYTDHPADRGGPTKYGITLATLQAGDADATAADVAALTEAEARDIYRARYIAGPNFDAVLGISRALGREVIDSGVNVGPARATEWLQHALNVAADEHLVVDGVCGPATTGTLAGYLASRDQARDILLAMLNALQGEFYVGLATRDPSQRRFVNGWFRLRVLPGLKEASHHV